ncbi:hypothetical protein Tco_1010567 [Tanacetum coccineum]
MDSSNQDPVVLFEEKGGEFVQEEKHFVSEMPLATSDREGIRTKHSTQETALNTLSPDERQDEVGSILIKQHHVTSTKNNKETRR